MGRLSNDGLPPNRMLGKVERRLVRMIRRREAQMALPAYKQDKPRLLAESVELRRQLEKLMEMGRERTKERL